VEILEVPPAPHPSAGETTKAGTEAVDALLASAQFADSAASGGSSRKSGSNTPKQAAPDLVELLLSSGQVTREEMEAALRESAATGGPSARS